MQRQEIFCICLDLYNEYIWSKPKSSQKIMTLQSNNTLNDSSSSEFFVIIQDICIYIVIICLSQLKQYLIHQMQPQSTVHNSLAWRLWHSINYMIGGITFFIGSFVLYPFMISTFGTEALSAWLYIIGSVAFLLADITEWLFYTTSKCPFLIYSINFFVSVIGSAFYLAGSPFYLPSVNQIPTGQLLFIVGSTFIYVSQAWKLIRSFKSSGKTLKEWFKEDQSGFFVDLFAGLGGLMYFIGTFVYQASTQNEKLIVLGATLYTFGGLFFSLSGLFVQKRYYFQDAQYPIPEKQLIPNN